MQNFLTNNIRHLAECIDRYINTTIQYTTIEENEEIEVLEEIKEHLYVLESLEPIIKESTLNKYLIDLTECTKKYEDILSRKDIFWSAMKYLLYRLEQRIKRLLEVLKQHEKI